MKNKLAHIGLRFLGETYFGNQSLMSKKLMPKIRAHLMMSFVIPKWSRNIHVAFSPKEKFENNII